MTPYTVSPYLRWQSLPPDQHAGDLSWQDSASCAQADPEEWFPRKGESTRRAKLICHACPVRVQCLSEALEHMGLYEYGTFGVWGGLSPDEREVAAAEYARGASLEEIIIAADVGWYGRLTAATERSRELSRQYAEAGRAERLAARTTDPQPEGAAA